MLMRCVVILALALGAAWALPAAQKTAVAAAPALVVIDPAHGGDETGVVADRLREKDITLQIALLIRQEAQRAGNLHVQLLRQADAPLSVADRIKAVQAARPACLVSLHVNAGFGKKAEGYEVYFPGFRRDASASGDDHAIVKDMTANRHLNDAVRLAQELQASLETVFPRKGRGLRDAPSALLEGVQVPALVVELGFATRAEERDRLTDPATQKALARAIVKGLNGYLQKAR